jgi:hypothetical protein
MAIKPIVAAVATLELQTAPKMAQGKTEDPRLGLPFQEEYMKFIAVNQQRRDSLSGQLLIPRSREAEPDNVFVGVTGINFQEAGPEARSGRLESHRNGAGMPGG